MGIYAQPNSWQCGPFALKHALLALGRFVHEDELTRLAGTTEDGTDERELAHAAKRFGYELLTVRKRRARSAARALRAWLGRGMPVLACVDQWDHWVTVVAAEGDEAVMFDSYYDTPLRVEPVARLLGRLAYRAPRGRTLTAVWPLALYDLHPVVPRRPVAAQLRLTPLRARHLLELEHGSLVLALDQYAERLLAAAAGAGGEPLDTFLLAHRAAILNGADPSAGARELERLVFVAGLYGLRVPAERREETVQRVARLVAQRAPVVPAAPGTPPPALAEAVA